MMETSSSNTASEKLVGRNPWPRLAYISSNSDLDADMKNSTLNSKDISYGECGSDDDGDNNLSTLGAEKVETVEAFNKQECNENDDNRMASEESPPNALSSQQLKKNLPKKKTIVVKEKQKKNPKLNIPGSAKKLKTKEKAVLTDGFSKYGQKGDVAVVK